MFSRNTIDVNAAHVLDNAMILDVRTKVEFRSGHVPGATHVSLDSVAQRKGWIARKAENRTILVICRSGNRSARATRHLRAMGLDALNVRGGMLAWQRRGLPVRAGT